MLNQPRSGPRETLSDRQPALTPNTQLGHSHCGACRRRGMGVVYKGFD